MLRLWFDDFHQKNVVFCIMKHELGNSWKALETKDRRQQSTDIHDLDGFG